MMIDSCNYGMCTKSLGIMPCQPFPPAAKCISCTNYIHAISEHINVLDKESINKLLLTIDNMDSPELTSIIDDELASRLEPYSLVKWSGDEAVYDKYYSSHFSRDKLLFISEVSNMKGHCMLCDLITGKIVGPYHIENFRMLSEDEV